MFVFHLASSHALVVINTERDLAPSQSEVYYLNRFLNHLFENDVSMRFFFFITRVQE